MTDDARPAQPTERREAVLGALGWIYVLVLGVVVFAIDHPWWLGGLCAAQFAVALAAGVRATEILDTLRRLATFFGFLIASYIVFGADWREGAWLCVRILAVIIASLAARGPAGSMRLFAGLEFLRVPRALAVPLTVSIAMINEEGGRGGGRGRGKGGGKGNGEKKSIREIIRSGAALITGPLARLDARAEAALAPYGLSENAAHDARVVVSTSVLTMATRFLKVAPGLPIAPGHKGIVLIPLYLHAARSVRGRFGAFKVGAVTAVISFLTGEGRFGVFEMLKHFVAGLTADLLLPLYRGNPSVFTLGFVSVIVALARFTTMALVTWLAGAPPEFWALIGTIGLTHVVFGALSGAVSRALFTLTDAMKADATLVPITNAADAAAPEPTIAQVGERRGGGGGGGGGGGRRKSNDDG